MGKKANVRSTPLASSSQDTEYSPEFRAAKAMFLLNEYMRYFGSVNGLCRQIVDVQKEVLCRLGRTAWKEMTQDELDKVLDKHIVNNYIARQHVQSNTGEVAEETNDWFPKPKAKLKARRDSLQSITEFNGQDGFSGPFTWKSRSLQDLSFPSTPEMEIKAKKQQTSAVEEQEVSPHDDDIKPSMTLEELKKELKRSYEDANAARQKMQQMNSPKSKKPPEKITKSAVNAKLASARTASVSSAKRPELNGMPLSPADLKPVSALKPVSQERLKSISLANGSQPAENRQSYLRSPPDPLPRPKTRSRADSTDKKLTNGHSQDIEDDENVSLGARTQSTSSNSGKSPRRGSLSCTGGKSPRHGSVSGKSGKSPRHDSVSSTSGKSPRHDSVSKRNSKSSRSGSFSKKTTSPDRMSVKEISEDLNQFFEGKTHQSSSGNGDTDMLMDLFKNW